jgi:bifunctional non-homologous end joining protein LigD
MDREACRCPLTKPALVNRPPAGAGWLHEVKHDGFRILARKRLELVNVGSHRGADLTYRFPMIAEAVRSPSADGAAVGHESLSGC